MFIRARGPTHKRDRTPRGPTHCLPLSIPGLKFSIADWRLLIAKAHALCPAPNQHSEIGNQQFQDYSVQLAEMHEDG
jgi:hypothetical protein